MKTSTNDDNLYVAIKGPSNFSEIGNYYFKEEIQFLNIKLQQ